jgi:KipI family sensor histidine kinase inhibitor
VRLLPCGEAAVLVEVDDLEAAMAWGAAVRAAPPVGVVDVVPAARTVLVRFDPAVTRHAHVAAHLRSLQVGSSPVAGGPLVTVPTVYDGADLGEVASLLGLTAAELVRRHTTTRWTVAFTGFAPGFAYLAGDLAWSVPRRTEPRTLVPAGSVAVAGQFTGVYPRASPGGWQLLGRTDLAVWDVDRPAPALLVPGARVRFEAVA